LRGAATTAVAATLLLAGACSNDEADEDTSAPSTTGGGGGGAEQSFDGTLAPPESADGAFTYDPAAPEGAELSVTVSPADDDTTFELTVSGLEPDRGYAVHAHTKPCGPTGDAAGPHFQDELDPAATSSKPSSDPAYANPENEVWLDLETDGEGAGSAEATVPFTFSDEAPASTVVHAEMETATEAGMAGMAGDRIACLDTPVE